MLPGSPSTTASNNLFLRIAMLIGVCSLLSSVFLYMSMQSQQSTLVEQIDSAFKYQAKQLLSKQSVTSCTRQNEQTNGVIAPGPKKKEKRVISFGLYGSNPKYTFGAIRNTELAAAIFPGWVCRFYVDNTVPQDVIKTLKDNGAEIILNEDIRGGIAGMFWRFLVADDPTVDRYIVRDSDSRLNVRDRTAVDEWIEDGAPVHVLRDHPNHGYVINGGMWGAVHGAIKNMGDKIKQWSARDSYMGDMDFLRDKIWPEIKDMVLSHDSWHCTNKNLGRSKSFPLRRFRYEHVGQVFDEHDVERMSDIQGFLDGGRQNPLECRRKPDWTTG